MGALRDTELILNPDGSVYHLGLVKENVSETIIAVGDPNRVERVSRHLDSVEFRINRREFVTHTGRLGEKRISVMSTGIGTDNVEIFFHEVDALFNVEFSTRLPKSERKSLNIIRVGTSGSLREDIPVDSYLVSDYAAGLDNLMSFYDLPMNNEEQAFAAEIKTGTGISFLPYVARGAKGWVERLEKQMIRGNTVTCPGFYAPQGRRMTVPIRYPRLLEDLGKVSGFRPCNFEMETAGYFALARLLGHHATSVNAILANRVSGKFSGNPDGTVDRLIKKILELL